MEQGSCFLHVAVRTVENLEQVGSMQPVCAAKLCQTGFPRKTLTNLMSTHTHTQTGFREVSYLTVWGWQVQNPQHKPRVGNSGAGADPEVLRQHFFFREACFVLQGLFHDWKSPIQILDNNLLFLKPSDYRC
jgi:hypothetical protein